MNSLHFILKTVFFIFISGSFSGSLHTTNEVNGEISEHMVVNLDDFQMNEESFKSCRKIYASRKVNLSVSSYPTLSQACDEALSRAENACLFQEQQSCYCSHVYTFYDCLEWGFFNSGNLNDDCNCTLNGAGTFWNCGIGIAFQCRPTY